MYRHSGPESQRTPYAFNATRDTAFQYAHALGRIKRLKFRRSCRSPPRGDPRSIHPHDLSVYASTSHFGDVASITASCRLIDSLQHSRRRLWLRATPAGITPECHQTISSPHVDGFVMLRDLLPLYQLEMLRKVRTELLPEPNHERLHVISFRQKTEHIIDGLYAVIARCHRGYGLNLIEQRLHFRVGYV